jgi:hypothetical protein
MDACKVNRISTRRWRRGSGAESHVYKNCGLSSADNRTKMRDVNDELSMVFFSGWNHTQTQLIAGFDGTMI